MAPLAELLRSRGFRVTAQRVVINDALHAAGRHLTADQVRDAVQERLPGVSLPTVYSTLELFERLGIVRRVNGGGGTLLWDTRPDAHHHMICRSCGRIEDLETPLDLERARRSASRAGFQPDRAEVVVSGLCAACAAK
jgi:Fur family ferric uptake transcriptional regulator/Fur family peroxide stress response transcriptional regulator